MSIFNGRDLTGWECDERYGKVLVQDGAIVFKDDADVFYPGPLGEYMLDCEIMGADNAEGVLVRLSLGCQNRSRGSGDIHVNFVYDGDVHVGQPKGAWKWKSETRDPSPTSWLPVRIEVRERRLFEYLRVMLG